MFGMLYKYSLDMEGMKQTRMKYVVLDFETTGSQADDEIIQVGLVTIDEHNIKERYSSFVKPRKLIPPFITQMTKITEEMVKDAPTFEEVITEMLPYLSDRILVGHQISFDLAFLQRALEQCGYSTYDGMVLDTISTLRICYPGLSSLQLSMVCDSLEIAHERPHQADSDAEVTAKIWLKCMDRL